jgi:2-polyprenyl-3-methyl-5-hydroxy-6-metoxy-1,4-benzoquinol methylase
MTQEGIESRNITAAVRKFHEQARARRVQPAAPLAAAADPGWHEELAALNRQCAYLYQIRADVGRMPPNPGTLRARLSAQIILLLKRLLFWYTPTITEFHVGVVRGLDYLCRLQERQSRHIRAQEAELESLRDELRQIRESDSHGNSLHVPTARPQRAEFSPARQDELASFVSSLQDRFRGLPVDVKGKQESYLRAIRRIKPSIPEAPWVDLGCGRGEWLAAVAAEGYVAVGVDDAHDSVSRCRAQGLAVERCDALEYLKCLPEGSVAVISAFHFLEHCPFDVVFSIFAEAARALKPGGMLLVEVPNPENLLMGAG